MSFSESAANERGISREKPRKLCLELFGRPQTRHQSTELGRLIEPHGAAPHGYVCLGKLSPTVIDIDNQLALGIQCVEVSRSRCPKGA